MARPKRLYLRIYLHILAVLLIVGVAAGGLFSLMFRTHTWRASGERLARRAAATFSDRLHDRAAREDRARRMADEFDVDLTLRDARGARLYAVGPELPPLSAVDMERLRRGTIFINQGRGRWFVAAPIFGRGEGGRDEVIGVLEVSLLRRLPVPNVLRPVALLALVLGLLALATWPLSRRISRPVERLTDANRRLGGGDLSYRIPLPCPSGRADKGEGGRHGGQDELLELMCSWNEMADRIEHLVRGQKELLANISHELRSPLTRIRLTLALLQDGQDGQDSDGGGREIEARLRDIEADLGELDRLIDDVLTTSRLEATGLPVHLANVTIAPLLMRMAERAGKPDQVRVAEVDPGIQVMGDGALLSRALWNLVENAMKYGAPPITLSAERAGDGIEIAVVDQGPGIDSAERQRVLEPFYRGSQNRARTPGGGFGLGLTLAARVAEVHGGSLRVEPARRDPDAGCRVVLRVAEAR